MKAFMVVGVPVCHIDLCPENAAASPNPSSLESSDRDQATPAFWTWFIENPRIAAPDLGVTNSRLKIEGG